MSKKNKNVRITLDLPSSLHTQVKTAASQKGETLRQFFIELASKQLENQNPTTTLKKARKMPKPIPLGTDNLNLKNLIDETQCPKF